MRHVMLTSHQPFSTIIIVSLEWLHYMKTKSKTVFT